MCRSTDDNDVSEGLATVHSIALVVQCYPVPDPQPGLVCAFVSMMAREYARPVQNLLQEKGMVKELDAQICRRKTPDTAACIA